MRALRTIPVMRDFAERYGGGVPGRVVFELHQPDGNAFRLYAARIPSVKTVGLCHSVQVCSEGLLKERLGYDGPAWMDRMASTIGGHQPHGLADWRSRDYCNGQST